jgi:hypothetical protein
LVRKDGAEARKERIAKIAQSIMSALYEAKQQSKLYISLRKTVAILEFETGLTKEKISEYITLLQDMGKIELDAEKDQIRIPEV